MSVKSRIKQAQAEVLNSFQAKQYRSEVGTKAVIERQELANEITDAFKEILRDLGQECGKLKPETQAMEYLGSVAVHIFQAPTVGILAFHTQNALGDTSELIAASAIADLRGSIMSYYGQRRQKLRSGF